MLRTVPTQIQRVGITAGMIATCSKRSSLMLHFEYASLAQMARAAAL